LILILAIEFIMLRIIIIIILSVITLRLASELIMLRVIILNVIKVGVIEITFHCSQNFDDPIMFAPRKRASRHFSG
jgi:hypothetical protein